jgi:hypothetical protein
MKGKPYGKPTRYLNPDGTDMLPEYKEFVLKKKNGKVRKIVAPNKVLLRYQRKKLPEMLAYYVQEVSGSPIEDTAHGFIRGRNVVTAAQKHIGFESTIMMDLSNFFDTVFTHMLPKTFQDSLFFHNEGYCAQGFATSPMLANIASIPMLHAIHTLLDNVCDGEFAFTIYADDIQISTNIESYDHIGRLINQITRKIEASGFAVNASKTRVKFAKYGFRRILGVNVGDNCVRATRKTMRKIRAAKHQCNYHSLGGLVNWSKCSLPKPKTPKDKSDDSPYSIEDIFG